MLLLLFATGAAAQDYNVALIPDSLKQQANAVKRFEEQYLKIKSPGRAVLKRRWAITILNEAGEQYNRYIADYGAFRQISDISGSLYDSTGKRLKSVKKKELSDLAYNDEISLMSDDRLKVHNFYYKLYPYTIEYEDEVELKGLFFLPYWDPVEDEKYAVQQSRFIVETPMDYRLRFKQFNYQGQPVIEEKDNRRYSWELKNCRPIEYEIYQPTSILTTAVFLAPSDFEINDYEGNMDSWQNLGKFVATLNAGRDQLPEKVKADIHRLADGLSSKEEKINVLYDYLQKNTRYISIQLGIGGWQPFEAKYVAEKRYGDCKALSNYMVSILKEAGINSNYVLVRSGKRLQGLWEDFPAAYFNHAIMCIPDGKDTLWLECTSQTTSPGYLGSSTGNRKALMITPEGGVVVNTPRYTAADNLQHRRIDATIDAAGNINAEVRTRFTGVQQELQHSLIHYANADERKKYLNNALDLPTYTVEKSEYRETRGRLPVVDEYLKIYAPSSVNTSGKRLFIQPNFFSKLGTKLPSDKPRKFNIDLGTGYKDVDTIIIAVPEGYQSESVPKDLQLNTRFGKYSVSYQLEGNKLKVLRVHELHGGNFPASVYPELVKFYDDIYKSDRSRVVLVKKE